MTCTLAGVAFVLAGWCDIQAGQPGDDTGGVASSMGLAVGAASAAYNHALEGGINGSPLVVVRLPERIERQLVQGYRLALERVQTRQECRALFAELGADGSRVLSATIYLPPRHDRELRVCDTGVPAFTEVGAPQTCLCDGFGRLSRQLAAVLLIHEALHHAGLDEHPHDPDGLTPHQINRMAARACGL